MGKNSTKADTSIPGINRRSALTLLGAASISSLTGAGCTMAKDVGTVETAYGRVRGFIDRGVHHFLGVRYGAPTGGENRFQAPRAPSPWSGVMDTVVYGNSAPQSDPDQSNGTTPNPPEDEDCLFLNIYTSRPARNRKRPVMVWLHGGAFSAGSASEKNTHGANLVRRGDVVMVGVNHRLNALGFAHLAEYGGEELAHSGNVGMIDVIFALEWIRDNIDAFGGDPDRVMIFGESGGGQKVTTLLASPLAKGLFSSAVIESGPGIRMIEPDQALITADMFMSELGLNRSNFNDIYTLPVEQLIRSHNVTIEKRGGIVPGFVNDFGPVIDGYYLTGHPLHDDNVGISADVPVIVGFNRTEMTLFVQDDEAVFNLTEAQMQERVEQIHGVESARLIIETYRNKYPALSPSNIFFLIWSDYPTMPFSNFIAEQRSALNRASTYLYRFDWETPVMGGKLKSPHTLEIPFVFDNIELAPELTGSEPDAFELAAKVSSTWVQFAETGSPNGLDLLPEWEAYNTTNRATMLISNTSKVANDPQKEERLLFQDMMN